MLQRCRLQKFVNELKVFVDDKSITAIVLVIILNFRAMSTNLVLS